MAASATSLSASSASSTVSSGSSSGVVSGDDDHDADIEAADESTERLTMTIERNIPVNNSNGGSGNSVTATLHCSDTNNCLPLKLRHKSHLGDKDAAATALLALQHIKQEPINPRTSPPSWTDGSGDNSSDERDSGISIPSPEWTAQFQRKVLVTNKKDTCLNPTSTTVLAAASTVGHTATEREHLLKSQLARLESEVATIKNMMIYSSDSVQLPTVTEVKL